MATPMVEDTNFEDDQLVSMTTDDIIRATRLLDNEIRIVKVRLLLFLSVSLGVCACYASPVVSLQLTLRRKCSDLSGSATTMLVDSCDLLIYMICEAFNFILKGF